MGIRYDPAKKPAQYRGTRPLFDAVHDMDFTDGIFILDDRFDYGEQRWQMLDKINGRLHSWYSPRGDVMHVISLRKANKREVKRYEQVSRS